MLRATQTHQTAIAGAAHVIDHAFDGAASISLQFSGEPACLACLLILIPPAALAYGAYRGVRRYLPHHQRPVAKVWKQQPGQLPPGIAAIGIADPGFSAGGFAAGALATYLAVARAELDDDATTLQMLLSPPLAEAARAHAAAATLPGTAEKHMPVVEWMLLVDAASDANGDSVGVLLRGRRAARHHASRRWWAAKWTFARAADARAVVPAPPLQCRNCGAALHLDDHGRCAFCSTLLISPTNWHVTAIEDLTGS